MGVAWVWGFHNLCGLGMKVGRGQFDTMAAKGNMTCSTCAYWSTSKLGGGVEYTKMTANNKVLVTILLFRRGGGSLQPDQCMIDSCLYLPVLHTKFFPIIMGRLRSACKQGGRGGLESPTVYMSLFNSLTRELHQQMTEKDQQMGKAW